MKNVKMMQVNGLWYPTSYYSIKLMKSTGMNIFNGFLTLSVLTKHLQNFNIGVKIK